MERQHLRTRDPLGDPVCRLTPVNAVVAFRPPGVELRADNVEGKRRVRSYVQHPESHALPNLRSEWVRGVLERAPIEHDRIGDQSCCLVSRAGPALVCLIRVELRLDDHVLLVHRFKAWRVNNHGPEHAVRDVQGHGGCRAVIHPDPGAPRGESVLQFLARLDCLHRKVRRGFTGVEVDGVPHGAVVDQGDHELVANVSPQSGPRRGPIKCPKRTHDGSGQVLLVLRHFERVLPRLGIAGLKRFQARGVGLTNLGLLH